jgi:hypothetical protein
MRRFGLPLAAIAVMAFTNPVAAQRQRASPHETTTATIEGARIEVTYGRPYKKQRTTWGGQLVPTGKVWRLGADEATTLKSDKALQFGNLTVPAGEHTLFLHYGGEDSAELIVNKQTGQWGTAYDEKQDLGRVPLKREKASAPVEQLTIAVEPQAGGGVLKITWDDATYAAPFKVQ